MSVSCFVHDSHSTPARIKQKCAQCALCTPKVGHLQSVTWRQSTESASSLSICAQWQIKALTCPPLTRAQAHRQPAGTARLAATPQQPARRRLGGRRRRRRRLGGRPGGDCPGAAEEAADPVPPLEAGRQQEQQRREQQRGGGRHHGPRLDLYQADRAYAEQGDQGGGILDI